MAVVNGAGGGMPMMNTGVNGATPRPGNEDDELDYEGRLNTYIYDYFVKNQRNDCARAMLNCDMPISTAPRRRDGDMNGSMHTDSKDDLESKIPDDLPLAAVPTDPQGASFLLEWFGLFWDVFSAHQRKAPPASAQAMQYVARTQNESRMRQEQQQNMLRVGMMPNGMNQMNEYQNMFFRPQNGMPSGDLRKNAMQNQNRHFAQNPQQAMAMQKQHMMQQMRRDPSELDMNGQRPRTPSSGDNAPSPSKRPRIDGHPGLMMMPNGRSQQMLDQSNNSPNGLLMQGGVPPNISPEQLAAFQSQSQQVQQKSLDIYNSNLKPNQRQNMVKPMMPNQGSPMMQGGIDMSAINGEYFSPNGMQMRSTMPGNGVQQGGNHALQDYQMQLMLLEQQNKKRLLMARQEQETPRGPDGQPAMSNFVGATGMSPSGSRSGPSPGPNDQVKRGTPKMGQVGLPGSPMPDGNMPQNRGSPASSMNLGPNMQGEVFPMKNMNEGMAVMPPNGNMMRQPPSSHPGYTGPFNPQMQEMQRRGMPNGGNWPQGAQGPMPMMPQQQQQQQQQPPPPPPQQHQPQQQQQQQQPMPQPQQAAPMGTPQQRGNMPPPSGVPAGAAANGRPASPAQPAAPPTPSQANKANPKGKKEAKDRKKPTKKGSNAGTVTAATPSSEAENPPPTPTPSTPITPIHPNSFNGQKGEAPNQSAVPQGPTTAAPAVEQPQPDAMAMDSYNLAEGDTSFDMTFGDFNSRDHFEGFDFDSFLTGTELNLEDGSGQFPFDGGVEPVGGN